MRASKCRPSWLWDQRYILDRLPMEQLYQIMSTRASASWIHGCSLTAVEATADSSYHNLHGEESAHAPEYIAVSTLR